MPALLPQATVRSRWLFVRGALNLGRGPGHRLLVAMRLRARPGRARPRVPDRQLPGAQLPVTLVQAPPRPAVAHLGAWASWALTHTRRQGDRRSRPLTLPPLTRDPASVRRTSGIKGPAIRGQGGRSIP